MVNKKISAECNCGAVAIELTEDVLGIYVCHFSICRRLSGSNGIAVIVTRNLTSQRMLS